MLNVNLSSFARPVVVQRRFRYLLAGLVGLALLIGLLVVPVEGTHPQSHIKNWFDGIWWAVTTVTGVGYGDVVPVTMVGRMLAMVLACVGVLAYGLILSMFSLALEETRDKYYRKKMFEQLDDIEHRLAQIEKHEQFVVKRETDQA